MPACHPRSRPQLFKSHCSHLRTLSHASGPNHLSRHRHLLALHFRTEPSRKSCRVGHQQYRQPRPRPACCLRKARAAAFCRHLPAACNGEGQQHSIFTSGLCASARRRQNRYCAMHSLALPSSDVPHCLETCVSEGIEHCPPVLSTWDPIAQDAASPASAGEAGPQRCKTCGIELTNAPRG